MTSNNVSDAAVLPGLLQQLPKDESLEGLTGDVLTTCSKSMKR